MGWEGPMTHRQYQCWQVWLTRQWNVPDRHDHYLMKQITTTRAVSGDDKATIDGQRIEFKLAEFAELPSSQKLVTRASAVDQQFEELRQQGYKVPKRMTKEDIIQAELWMHQAQVMSAGVRQ